MLRKITDYKHDYHSFLGAYAKFINARNVVEIGVQTGDCATFLVDAVTINGGKYYGYDIWESIGVYNSDNVDVDDIRHKLIMEGYNSNFYKLTKINTHSEEFKDVLCNDTNGVIDFAFIDGDHSYEGVKRDFELYSNLMSDNGIITIHDTDQNYHNTFLVPDNQREHFDSFDGPAKFIKELENNTAWNLVNLKNFIMFDSKRPTTTGITILAKKDK